MSVQCKFYEMLPKSTTDQKSSLEFFFSLRQKESFHGVGFGWKLESAHACELKRGKFGAK